MILRTAGGVIRTVSAAATGLGGSVDGAAGLAFTSTFDLSLAAGLAVVEVTRFDRPKRCTLPITALRVTPPNSFAMTLADWPSPHIFQNFDALISPGHHAPLNSVAIPGETHARILL